MSNNHKLVLFFLFFKRGLSGTRFVQLLSVKHGSGFVNYGRMDVLKVGTVAIPAWVQINSKPSAVMMESGTQMFEL